MVKRCATALILGCLVGCASNQPYVQSLEGPIGLHYIQLSKGNGAFSANHKGAFSTLALYPESILEEADIENAYKTLEPDGVRKTSIILSEEGQQKLRAISENRVAHHVAIVHQEDVLKTFVLNRESEVPRVIEIID